MSNGIDRVLSSTLLGGDVPYRVLLPSEYEANENRYAVLYLLHGMFGGYTNWTELTNIGEYANRHRMIIVMPEGGERWYTDSVEMGERYLIDELIPEIDVNFRTIADRDHRAIAGNSMGGYGAFKYALKYPDMFDLAGSFSGAFHVTDLSDASPGPGWPELGPSVRRVFGEAGSTVRTENAISHLAGGEHGKLPYLYFDCGAGDEFAKVNREMAKRFAEDGIDHEFHEFEGGHDWIYWDRRIERFLDLISARSEKRTRH
jgi:S-formylglutathione hydrolase FrmB